jgi:hypothetical protein
MRVDLPDGEWAEFHSPRKVSDRHRRAFLRAMSDVSAATADTPKMVGPSGDLQPAFLTGEQTELEFHAFDLLLMCFVKAWSLEGEPTLEAVEDLDVATKDALMAHAMPLMGEMMPDFGADPDPKARTGGSPPPPTPSPKALETFATTSSDGTS